MRGRRRGLRQRPASPRPSHGGSAIVHTANCRQRSASCSTSASPSTASATLRWPKPPAMRIRSLKLSCSGDFFQSCQGASARMLVTARGGRGQRCRLYLGTHLPERVSFAVVSEEAAPLFSVLLSVILVRANANRARLGNPACSEACGSWQMRARSGVLCWGRRTRMTWST